MPHKYYRHRVNCVNKTCKKEYEYGRFFDGTATQVKDEAKANAYKEKMRAKRAKKTAAKKKSNEKNREQSERS